MSNYYEILGIDETASADIIKNAYRDMAKKYHPDVCKESDAEDKIKQINEAYETLGDEEKRRQYDFQQKNPSGDWRNLFHNTTIHNPFTRVERIMPNSHIHLRHGIDIADILHPIDLTIQYNKFIMCDTCNGNGGLEETVCPTCKGMGVLTQYQSQGMISFAHTSTCGDCGGAGKTYRHKCVDCNATGYRTITIDEVFHVPVGQIGKRMIYPGKGNQENKAVPPGMLTLDIGIIDHPDYRVESLQSIVYLLPLDPVEAILGGKYNAKSIEGNEITVNIPKGCPPGYREEFKEMGIPLDSTHRGSLYAEVVYKIPDDITQEQENALKKYLKNKKTNSKRKRKQK